MKKSDSLAKGPIESEAMDFPEISETTGPTMGRPISYDRKYGRSRPPQPLSAIPHLEESSVRSVSRILSGKTVSVRFPSVATVQSPYARRFFAKFVTHPAFSELPATVMRDESIRIEALPSESPKSDCRIIVSQKLVSALLPGAVQQAFDDVVIQMSTAKDFVEVSLRFA